MNNTNELSTRPPHPPAYEQLYPTTHQLTPTVFPCNNFNPDSDAEEWETAVRMRFKMALITLVTTRSKSQIIETCKTYRERYSKELIQDVKSILSGDFKNLMVALLTPFPIYFAKELFEAMDGPGTNEYVLIEILCSLPKDKIDGIRSTYKSLYNRALEDDIRDDTSGKFKRLMISLCCASRDTSMKIDIDAAVKDAKKLLDAAVNNADKSIIFDDIFVRRNMLQVKQIFCEYEKISGHTIEHTIKKTFSGDMKKGLLAIVSCVNNRAGFFADCLARSMIGLGTDDRSLIRLIVTRCEIDLGEIKQAFQLQYGKTLEDFIKDDCSGHYRKCLLALVAGK